MNVVEMADVLAKVQMGDHRTVDETVIDYWMSLIGDLQHGPALGALRRFRRERPGVYLEPGHLLELAGVVDEQPSSIPDITDEVLVESKMRMLAAAGVSEDEYAEHENDVGWVREKFAHLVEARPALPVVEDFDHE